jgi:hypothetical protein
MSLSEPRIALARLARLLDTSRNRWHFGAIADSLLLGPLLLEAGGVAAGGATMTSTDLLPAAVLKRKAVVYIRQSTQARVAVARELAAVLLTMWRSQAPFR